MKVPNEGKKEIEILTRKEKKRKMKKIKIFHSN
jgi:hypothetical protein